MKFERPFDALNENRGKNISVELKNGKLFAGVLEAFDIHLNLTLSSAKEDNSKENGCDMIIRGDAIVTIKLKS